MINLKYTKKTSTRRKPFKSFRFSAFLNLPEHHTNAMVVAGVNEYQELTIRISDCNGSIRLHTYLSSPKERTNALYKIKALQRACGLVADELESQIKERGYRPGMKAIQNELSKITSGKEEKHG